MLCKVFPISNGMKKFFSYIAIFMVLIGIFSPVFVQAQTAPPIDCSSLPIEDQAACEATLAQINAGDFTQADQLHPRLGLCGAGPVPGGRGHDRHE